MDSELRVGDFAKTTISSSPRLIISCLGTYLRSLGRDGDFWVLYLNKSTNTIVHGTSTMYIKIQPTSELIKIAKRNLKRVFKKHEIDNLTYIEILEKLREDEKK